jgi:phosphopantothenoylcysteine decarboxylase/phosphopantothenate--cysteine ligase
MTTRRPDTSESTSLDGYEVVVCVCGGIAAYKVCEVVSRLVQGGAGVTVAMTKAARKFVGPVTFQALTGRPVLTKMWVSGDAYDIQHISLTEAADLVLVAPATANMIGKMAGGIADDLVSTLIVSAASPVVVAPAMNNRMWANPAVKDNVAKLNERGYRFVGPKEGWLACRTAGPGRMAEPAEILEAIISILVAKPAKRAGKEV